MLKFMVRVALAAFFVMVGRLHFTQPKPFLKIVPPPLPASLCVYVSGALEILGGLGLLVHSHSAAWLLIWLLVGVFPANIYMAVKGIRFGKMPTWMLWARLPMQPLLMGIVWWAGA